MTQKNSSETSTPTEEYLTPTSDSVPLTGTSAFHFSDPSIKSILQNASAKPSGNSHGTFRISRTGSNVESVVAPAPTTTNSSTKQPNRKQTQTINTNNLNLQTNNNQLRTNRSNQEESEMLPTKLTSNRHPISKPEEGINVDNDLLAIRKKLEERRRKMEIDKRKMEEQWHIQKQAASKEAFSALFGSSDVNKFQPGDVAQITKQPPPNNFHGNIPNKKLSSSFSSSSGYYSQDSAIAMEKLFAHENASNVKNDQVKKSASEQNMQKSPQKVLPKSNNPRSTTQQQQQQAQHHHPSNTTSKPNQAAQRPQKMIQQQQQQQIKQQQHKLLHKPSLDSKKPAPSYQEQNRKKPMDPKKSSDPNYGTSLDRLNSSLSELQGEIMRLSLQQDHIKNLVTTNNNNNGGTNDNLKDANSTYVDRSPDHDNQQEQRRQQHKMQQQQQYEQHNDDTVSNYEMTLDPQQEGPRLRHSYSNGTQVLPNNVNNPRRHSAFQRYNDENLYPSVGDSGDNYRNNCNDGGGGGGVNPRLSYPQDHPMMHPPRDMNNIPIPHLPLQIPSVGPYMHPMHHPHYPYYPPPPPPPHPQMMNYYPYAVNPYYQTLNYPLNYNAPNFGIRSRGVSPHFRSLDPRKDNIPLRKDSSFGGISEPQAVRSQSHYAGQRSRRESLSANRSGYASGEVRRLSRPSSVVSDYFSGLNFLEKDFQQQPSSSYPSYDYPQPSHSSQQQHARNSISSPGFYPSHTLQYSPSKEESTMMTSMTMDPRGGDYDDDFMMDDDGGSNAGDALQNDDEPMKQLQQAEFFVVNLEAPKRPKPEIGLNRNKTVKPVKTVENSASSSVVVAGDNKNSDVTVEETKLKNVKNSSSSLSKTDEDASETGSVGFIIEENELDSSEVERAKVKLAELHQRRKEELEMKKNKINKDQSVKKEQRRMKEEKALQKKLDEKQRREAIFQQYLQRKAADLNDSNSTDDDINNNNNFHNTNNSSRPSPSSNNSSSNKSNSNKSSPGSVALSSTSRANKARVSSATTKQRPQSQLIVGSSAGNAVASSNSNNMATVKKSSNNGVQDDSVIGSKQQQLQQQQQQPYTADVVSIGDPFDVNKKQERFNRFLSCGSDGGSEDNSSGLKLFVKPNQKSNKSIIINAIKDCCLAGAVNHDLKNRVIEEINRNDSKHFVVLFRDAGLQYRAVYSYNPDKQEVLKIHGVGPRQLVDKTMEKFFKYNSGAKNFSEVTSTKHLSSTIDGVTIPACLWTKKPSSTTATNTAGIATATSNVNYNNK